MNIVTVQCNQNKTNILLHENVRQNQVTRGFNYILVVRPPCSVQGTYREANVFLDIIFPDKWPGQVRDMPPTPQTSDITSLNFRYCLHIFHTSEINVKSCFTGIRNIGLHYDIGFCYRRHIKQNTIPRFLDHQCS
jgi:hypothetical protein